MPLTVEEITFVKENTNDYNRSRFGFETHSGEQLLWPIALLAVARGVEVVFNPVNGRLWAYDHAVGINLPAPDKLILDTCISNVVEWLGYTTMSDYLRDLANKQNGVFNTATY